MTQLTIIQLNNKFKPEKFVVYVSSKYNYKVTSVR